MRPIYFMILLLSVSWAQDSQTMVQATTQTDYIAVSDTDSTIRIDELNTISGSNSEPSLAILRLNNSKVAEQMPIDVNSVLLDVIQDNNLAEIAHDLESDPWYNQDNELCLADSCLDAYEQATSLSSILVWDLRTEETINQLFLSIIQLKSPYQVQETHITLDQDLDLAKQQIRKSVWELFGKTPLVTYDEEAAMKPWYQWFITKPNQYYLSGAGGVILVWILLQSDEEPAADDIGLPPEWP